MDYFASVAGICFLTVCGYEFGIEGVTLEQLLLIAIVFAVWGIFYWLVSNQEGS